MIDKEKEEEFLHHMQMMGVYANLMTIHMKQAIAAGLDNKRLARVGDYLLLASVELSNVIGDEHERKSGGTEESKWDKFVKHWSGPYY